MVFEEDSIVSFTPSGDDPWEVVSFVDGKLESGYPIDVIGWAVVVTARDMRAVHTEVAPVVFCCGEVVVWDKSHASGHPSDYWELRKLSKEG